MTFKNVTEGQLKEDEFSKCLPHTQCFHPFLPPPSAEQTTNAVPTVMTPPQKHFHSHVFFIYLHAFFSYICMRVCMRGFFHTFVCVFVCVFLSYLCMRVCMRVFFIHLYAGFFSYICMRVFLVHLYAGFCHTFVCDFVCVFLSYICMRVFFIHFYICIWVVCGAVVSVVVQ